MIEHPLGFWLTALSGILIGFGLGVWTYWVVKTKRNNA